MSPYKPLFEMAIKHTFLDTKVSPKEKAKLIINDALERSFYWSENEEGEVSEEEISLVNAELEKLVDKINSKLRIGNIHSRAEKRAGK